ncbi:phosphoenolpyruvate synthase [Nanoarchaeota archaeon]
MGDEKTVSADDLLKEVDTKIKDTHEEYEEKPTPPTDFEKKAASDFIKSNDVVWLSDITKDDVSIGGGKGANLAEMYNLKLPVPPAFIVTAGSYKKFIEKTGLKQKMASILQGLDFEDTKQLEFRTHKIRELVIQEEMPEEVEHEIKKAYKNLDISREVAERASQNVLNILKTAREPPFVAVRSSATAEDLAGASFAGQQDTYLNIKGWRNLVDAVKRCWASLFTARATYYRHKKGFPQEKVLIAIIVQKMINSDKSGVTFTINPTTNNSNEIVIEAVFGLGEGIVSGAISPDHYVVDKATLKPISKKVSIKNTYFTRSAAGETIQKELIDEKKKEQVLDSYDLTRIATYAKQLEDHYKVPQDIEWGTEYGKVYILQTRPVTTHEKEISMEEVTGEVILEGLPASPGVATGTVKIIKDLADLSKIQSGDVLVTKMTNPDMVVTMQKASAIVTDEGGMTAHAAIISRELGIPCIVGTMKATLELKEGQVITIDGKNGKVYKGETKTQTTHEVKPQALTLPQEAQEENVLDELARVESPQTPKTETKTKIYMNLGQPNAIEKYRNLDFDGIGLMRVEFIIASEIKKHPLYMIELNQQQEYIDKLAEGISKVASTISPKPVIVRFSDLRSNEYKGLEGGEKYELYESNPMIGYRGISRYVSEGFEKAFRLECKAIKKVREQNKNVQVMLPFVRNTSEVLKCLEIMKTEGLERSEDFKVLLMAEVPSMALIPEEFAKLPIDGASIGSNDLTQLVLGVDRDSALLGRMGYFDERNKAVLVALSNIIKGFHKHNKSVSICGQAPSVYPEMTEFLVKQGINSISVNPDTVNKTKDQVNRIENSTLSI